MSDTSRTKRTLNRTHRTQLQVVVIIVAAINGCVSPPRVTNQERACGAVFILPGIEGEGRLNHAVAAGLKRGGVPYAVEIFDWGAPGGVLSWHRNLTDYQRNQSQARRLAGHILDYWTRNPELPVHLVAHSGGAGIALMALAALPADVRIETVILLGPAVSPTYDLRVALGRTQRGIWNFYSHTDVAFLGAGTTVFGTIDRQHVRAAGAVGFTMPEKIGPEGCVAYERLLHQRPYRAEMARVGHPGSHIGWASQAFVQHYLVPIVMDQGEVVSPASLPRAGSPSGPSDTGPG